MEASPSPLFRLPLELRELVYRHILRSANNRHHSHCYDSGPLYRFDLRLLRVSRRVHDEAKRVFQENVFVKITTPWPEAIQHVNSEGCVAVVAQGQTADDFQAYHLRAMIDTPATVPWSARNSHSHSMVTTLEEVDAFATTWYFSNLNNCLQLNPHLTLRLDLKNPHERQVPLDVSLATPVDAQVGPTPISRGLQKRLVLPFGQVTGLHTMAFDWHGRPFFGYAVDDDIRDMVVEAQQIPPPSPEACIDSCVKEMARGHVLANKKEVLDAIRSYVLAFSHIHIYITACPGSRAPFPTLRHRTIHCDAYYSQELAWGQYKGQFSHYIRMMLRVQLVLAFIKAYRALSMHEEAYYWGRRTVTLYRGSMTGVSRIGGHGWSDWIKASKDMGVSGMHDMAWVFWHTAHAAADGLAAGEAWMTERDPALAQREIRALLQAAHGYRPNEPAFKQQQELDGDESDEEFCSWTGDSCQNID